MAAAALGRDMGALPALRRVLTRRLRTALGEIVAGASDDGICTLEFAPRTTFAEQSTGVERYAGNAVPTPPRRPVRGAPGGHARSGSHAHLDALEIQLDEYFGGRRRRFDLPLVLAGTDFKERVWRALLDIRYGTTISYAELARRVGVVGGPRAVGRANGDNRIAIVVPCHRVIRADGGLGGYSGGLARKRRLLELEAGTAQRNLFRRSGTGSLPR